MNGNRVTIHPCLRVRAFEGMLTICDGMFQPVESSDPDMRGKEKKPGLRWNWFNRTCDGRCVGYWVKYGHYNDLGVMGACTFVRNRESWETTLADYIYHACPGFVAPCHGGFPPRDDYDALIGHLRSTVEHWNERIQDFKSMKDPWRHRNLELAMNNGVNIARLLAEETKLYPVQRQVKFELTRYWKGPYPTPQRT